MTLKPTITIYQIEMKCFILSNWVMVNTIVTIIFQISDATPIRLFIYIYFAIKHQWGTKSSKTKKSVKMTLYYNFRRHYDGMMTSPKIFCHVTSICKVSLFYLVPFKRYDNLKFVFWATWFQNMTKNGNFITWYEFKMWKTKFCTPSQSFMLIAFVLQKLSKKVFLEGT